MVVALAGNPPHLNIDVTGTFLVYNVASQVYSALIRYDKDLNWVPDLAYKWQISSDKLTWTFNLVRNATWHDGVPFTSKDVKFSFEKLLSVYAGAAKLPEVYANMIVETPDDYTVVMKLRQFNALTYYIIGDRYAMIYPEHLWKNSTRTLDDMLANPRSRQAVGTGPFMFKEFVPNDHVTLVRNPSYFKTGKPYLDSIIYRIVSNPQTMITGFLAGQIHYLPRDAPLSSLAQLKGDSNAIVKVVAPVSGFMVNLYPNTLRSPLNNTKVRQALSYAVDRNQLVKDVFFGQGAPGWNAMISSLAPQARDQYNPNIVKYEYDVAKANRLLDEAGYRAGSDGTRFTLGLMYDSSRAEQAEIARVLEANYAKIGVKLNFKAADIATAQSLGYVKKDFDLWITEIVTWNNILQMASRVTKSGIGPFVGGNIGSWWSPVVENLFDSAMAERDDAKRQQIVFQIERIVSEEEPIIPLVDELSIQAWKKDFANIPEPVNPAAELLESVYSISAQPTTTTSAAPTIPENTLPTVAAVVIVVMIAASLFLRARRKGSKRRD